MKKVIFTLFASFLLLSGCSSIPDSVRAEKKPVTSKTIVFVHGMYNTSNAWEKWEKFFQKKGYKTISTPWPFHDASPANLRAKHPDPNLGKLGFTDLVNHYSALIKKLPEKPILIGHSLGGVVVQKLISDDPEIAVAVVAIHPGPPKGIISLRWSFLKSNKYVLNPFANKEAPFLIDVKEFEYAFGNTLPENEVQAAYDQYLTPESRKVALDILTEKGEVDFNKKRVPLLILGAEKDQISPVSISYANFQKYETNPSPTDFALFKNTSHSIADPLWETEAIYIANWLER